MTKKGVIEAMLLCMKHAMASNADECLRERLSVHALYWLRVLQVQISPLHEETKFDISATRKKPHAQVSARPMQ
jgi:hypothetical protein